MPREIVDAIGNEIERDLDNSVSPKSSTCSMSGSRSNGGMAIQ